MKTLLLIAFTAALIGLVISVVALYKMIFTKKTQLLKHIFVDASNPS